MAVVFGGVVASILLGLYGYTVVTAIRVALHALPPDSFTPGFSSAMTTIGALVSAVVIAELAVTPPGGMPLSRVLTPTASRRARRIVTAVTWGYLLGWILTGLAAFVVATLWNPDALKPLTDLGLAWLGAAIACVYAYLGVKPSAGRDVERVGSRGATDGVAR